MKLCDYGCDKEAIHQFKNGKWCCSYTTTKCLKLIEKNRIKNTGKKRSTEFKKRTSKRMLGKNNPMFGTGGYWKNKKRNKDVIKKFKISHRQTINDIKKKYPTFAKVEEMRYKPGKEKEKVIQVHCKNHKCNNSKEQNGWFIPTYIQLYERIRNIERDGSYFYCCDNCKLECPLFNIKSDPNNVKERLYTSDEYQTWRLNVLERENYICEYCGKPATDVHHSRPQKLEPSFVLDPDFGIACCEKCHYKYGHKTGTECSTGNLANKICI